MKVRLQAVQRAVRSLIASALVIGVLGLPLGNDGELMGVLEELTTFQQGFDQERLEQQLLEGVRAQGQLALSALAGDVTGKQVPKVVAAPNAAPLSPRAQLELGSLAAVHRLGQGGATVDMASADGALLARSLAWRLARDPQAADVTLLSAELTELGATADDVARERSIAELRDVLLDARSTARRTEKKAEAAEELYRARIKWKAHWRAIAHSDEKRKEAQAEMEAAASALKEAETRYAKLTAEADAFSGKGSASGAQGAARLSLQRGETRLDLLVPVALTLRPAPVPPLTGSSFAATHAAGLWEQVENGSADAAIETVRSLFSWHYRFTELGGVKLGGMTVLTWAPLVLVWLLVLLLRRSRGVSASYNPFNRPQHDELPMVGLGAVPLDLLGLVALPLTSCVLCAWSLTEVHQFAAVPILCGLVVTGLGSFAHLELKELRSLRDAIRRSHSQPPAAPAEDSE